MTMMIVGIDIAMYSSHQLAMKSEKTGRKISPIDQNNSNKIETIIRARPLVMSTTENMQKFANEILFSFFFFFFLVMSFYLNSFMWKNLHIIWPDVYMRAHVPADSQRNSKWNSYTLINPVKFPHTIWLSIPMTITFFGLMLHRSE